MRFTPLAHHPPGANKCVHKHKTIMPTTEKPPLAHRPLRTTPRGMRRSQHLLQLRVSFWGSSQALRHSSPGKNFRVGGVGSGLRPRHPLSGAGRSPSPRRTRVNSSGGFTWLSIAVFSCFVFSPKLEKGCFKLNVMWQWQRFIADTGNVTTSTSGNTLPQKI